MPRNCPDCGRYDCPYDFDYWDYYPYYEDDDLDLGGYFDDDLDDFLDEEED